MASQHLSKRAPNLTAFGLLIVVGAACSSSHTRSAGACNAWFLSERSTANDLVDGPATIRARVLGREVDQHRLSFRR